MTYVIYELFCVDEQIGYVGHTMHEEQRMIDHFNELELQKHGNKRLQEAYNKYGEASFRITILERLREDITLEDVLIREQHYMDRMGDKKYNMVRAIREGKKYRYRGLKKIRNPAPDLSIFV